MLEMVYDPTSTIPLKFIDMLYNLVILHAKLVIEFVDVDRLEHLWAKRNNRNRLNTRASGLAEVHV